MQETDLFDDFEMQPLTEGLGFHKKAQKIKREASGASLAKSQLQREVPAQPAESMLQPEAHISVENPAERAQPELDTKKALEDLVASLNQPASASASVPKVEEPSRDLKITSTLPRERDQRASVEVDLTIDTPMPFTPKPQKKEPGSQPSLRQTPIPASEIGVRRGAADSPMLESWTPQCVSFSSAILDAIVVLAFSMIFLVSLLLVTKVDLLAVMMNAQRDLPTQLSMGLLYVAVMFMYVIISRSFFGKTLGEWTFDLQMGDSEQVRSGWYPILVVWRGIFNLLTGVVVLPILSFIIRKDITSYFTGLQLYRRRG